MKLMMVTGSFFDSFRIMLFQIVMKQLQTMQKLSLSFRIMLFQIVMKLTLLDTITPDSFRIMLFQIVMKRIYEQKNF